LASGNLLRLPFRLRPDSSVVEHFHGKEGVDSSILSRGSFFSEYSRFRSWLSSSVG
jgi:hypothetical protein